MFHFSVTGHAADGKVGDVCLQDVMVMWVLCLLLAVALVVRLFNKVSKGKVPALPEVQFKDLFSLLFSLFFHTHTHTHIHRCVCTCTHTHIHTDMCACARARAHIHTHTTFVCLQVTAQK